MVPQSFIMLQNRDAAVEERSLFATQITKIGVKHGQNEFGTLLALTSARHHHWRTHMQYQPLKTQKLWDEKAKQENKIFELQRAKESAKKFFLFMTCMALMGFAFWCYWTHQTWLPETLAQFDHLVKTAPEKVLNNSVMKELTVNQ